LPTLTARTAPPRPDAPRKTEIRPLRALPARALLRACAVAATLVAGIGLVGCGDLATPTSIGSAHGSPNGQPVDAGAFAPGACVAFAPTKGDRHETVFLDAGHGGLDPGGVGTTPAGQTIYEADETLPVELDTMALLRAKGYRVVVSRTGSSTVVRLGPTEDAGGLLTLQGSHDDVVARDECADDAGANVLLGIYFDAGSSPQNAGSLTAYDAARTFSPENLAFATLVQRDVLADMNAHGWGIPDDGVVPDTALGSYVGDPSTGGIAGAAASYDHLLLIGPAQAGYFSTPSDMPGAVIEPLYITDPFEGSIANTRHGQMVMAGGMAAAVEQFLNPAPAHPAKQAKSG
jgi:N-acetylmuramoyl-L-alanine amidase